MQGGGARKKYVAADGERIAEQHAWRWRRRFRRATPGSWCSWDRNSSVRRALSPGGLAVSPVVRQSQVGAELEAVVALQRVMLAIASCMCSSRISGSERALPKPAYPRHADDGRRRLVRVGGVAVRGSGYQIGFVNVVGNSAMLNCV